MSNKIVRVTEVLGHFKEGWYTNWMMAVGKKQASVVKKIATDIGSRVDELIKIHPSDPQPEADEVIEIHNCVKAYKKWYADYSPKFVSGQNRITTNISGVDVTGEPDLLVDGIVVDIKCARKISPTYWIQIAMYTIMMGKGEGTNMAVLRLDKQTGSYEYVVRPFAQRFVDVWLWMAEAYLESIKGENDEQARIRQERSDKEVEKSDVMCYRCAQNREE